jgi:hypothetical protein
MIPASNKKMSLGESRLDVGLEINDKLSTTAGPANKTFDKAFFFGVAHDYGELVAGIESAGPQSTDTELALCNLILARERLNGGGSALPAKEIVIWNLVSAVETERHSNPRQRWAITLSARSGR